MLSSHNKQYLKHSCLSDTLTLLMQSSGIPFVIIGKSFEKRKTNMHKGIQIGASIMCADILRLEQEVRDLEQNGVDYIHYDVMDGLFVPNFGLNLDMLKAIRSISTLPINVHFMVEEPVGFFKEFARAGANSISFHQEAVIHTQRAVMQIKGLGLQAGAAINPGTPVDVLEYLLDDLDFVLMMTVNPGFAGQKLIPSTLGKIKELREMVKAAGLQTRIQADGNVSFENIPQMVAAGADMLVGGTSSLYKEGLTIQQAMEKIREVIK